MGTAEEKWRRDAFMRRVNNKPRACRDCKFYVFTLNPWCKKYTFNKYAETCPDYTFGFGDYAKTVYTDDP